MGKGKFRPHCSEICRPVVPILQGSVSVWLRCGGLMGSLAIILFQVSC